MIPVGPLLAAVHGTALQLGELPDATAPGGAALYSAVGFVAYLAARSAIRRRRGTRRGTRGVLSSPEGSGSPDDEAVVRERAPEVRGAAIPGTGGRRLSRPTVRALELGLVAGAVVGWAAVLVPAAPVAGSLAVAGTTLLVYWRYRSRVVPTAREAPLAALSATLVGAIVTVGVLALPTGI